MNLFFQPFFRPIHIKALGRTTHIVLSIHGMCVCLLDLEDVPFNLYEIFRLLYIMICCCYLILYIYFFPTFNTHHFFPTNHDFPC